MQNFYVFPVWYNVLSFLHGAEFLCLSCLFISHEAGFLYLSGLVKRLVYFTWCGIFVSVLFGKISGLFYMVRDFCICPVW